MRLTLKTILAYSDDLFDAEYRPAIEKRISEDDAAAYVINRMQSVVRNPDTPVPGRCGEKEEMSANLVAAYLDNLLSDAEQSRFETICLRSDIYLAEIACSHQILTTILGQPAKLSRDCRLRLYAIPRHRRVQSANHPADDENQEPQEVESEPQADMKIEPEPRKKRRITVTAQENSGSHTAPTQESQEMPPERTSNPEVPADNAEQTPGSTESTAPLPIGKISRLGQAFAHRKRHRSIMMVFSLALLFLCVSVFLFAHRRPKQSENNEVSQHKPPATASALPVPDGEITNAQRLNDHHHFWGPRDTASTTAGQGLPSLIETEMAARNDAIYSFNESPDRVMEYLPGQNGVPPQSPHPAGIPPGGTLSLAQAGIPLPPASPLGFSGESPPVLQQSPARQNPLHQPRFPTTVNMSNAPGDNRSMPGNTMINGISEVQNMTAGRYSVQPSPHSGATIQLIDDHGNVPSVNRMNRSSLPAVQPATWGTGERSGDSPENTSAGSNHQTAFPQGNRSIEQVSYTPAPGQSHLPPLIEPNWNEANHGGFERVADLPQIPGNPVASAALPPLRLPETIASPNSVASARRHHLMSSENTAGSNLPVLVLGMEDLALVRETPETEWSWLPVSKPLVHDIVLVPAPFRAVFMFPNGIAVETEGDTRVQILPDDEAGHPTLAFDCGHLVVYATASRQTSGISQSLRIVTPVGGGVLRFTDTNSHVVINSENKTTVKLLKVTRHYESVTGNPLLNRGNLDNNVVYCPNLMSFPAEGKTIYWQKDGNAVEWKLAAVSIFPIDLEKSISPILLYHASNLIVAPAVVWPALVSHDGRIPISKLDLKNQFVTMPHTFYPTPTKTWLLK